MFEKSKFLPLSVNNWLTAKKELTDAFRLKTISRLLLSYFCCEIFKNNALSVLLLIETSW